LGYFSHIEAVNDLRFDYLDEYIKQLQKMRKRFEQQITIGRKLVEDTVIPTAKRNGALPGLCAALKEIYVTPKWNEQVFEILEKTIYSKNNNTGRPGMNLWEIFVLSQVRLCQNISYDDLHYIANHDKLIRQIMGVESTFCNVDEEFTYQRIIDNVGLLDDETVKKLNEIIISLGHDTFKKKEKEALRLKTDSFVIESNVHFPTDYNLLWDSARKCLDFVAKIQQKNNLYGWRKLKDWNSELKNKMRALGKASASGGKGKKSRIKETAQCLLTKAKSLMTKLESSVDTFPRNDKKDIVNILGLKAYMSLLKLHIDLLKRRIIDGEEIPHSEKIFSIFEDYTEWITKGKLRPNVELGKRTSITTDQYNLIIDYQVMDHQTDSEIVPDLARRIFEKFEVNSWSFDKGFWNKNNKKLLKENVVTVVLPKKGKCNKEEHEEEHKPLFKKLRNKHSAVESNINELEHRGLNRCPDKGYSHFKRYVGLAICAYNLRKIGNHLISEQRKVEQEFFLQKSA